MFFTAKRVQLYLAALLLLQCLAVLSCWRIAWGGTADFRLFYASGHIIRAGEASRLYDYGTQLLFQNQFVSPQRYTMPPMEPPFAALAFVPFTFVRYFTAFVIFFVINLLVVALTTIVLRPWLPHIAERMPRAPALLILSFFPLGVALSQGQFSILVLAAFCIAFALLQRDRPLAAGVILSLGLLKFQITLPVVLLYLLWRQWKLVTGFAIGSLALGLISFAMIGLRGLVTYWHALFPMPAALPSAEDQIKFGIAPLKMVNLYGLFYLFSRGHTWGVILTAVTSVLLIVWAARKPPSLPLATLVGVLISFHLFVHDLTVLLLPLALLLNQQLSPSIPVTPGRTHTIGAAALGALLITPVSLFLMSFNVFPLLVIAIAALTLTLGPTIADRRPIRQPHPAELSTAARA